MKPAIADGPIYHATSLVVTDLPQQWRTVIMGPLGRPKSSKNNKQAKPTKGQRGRPRKYPNSTEQGKMLARKWSYYLLNKTVTVVKDFQRQRVTRPKQPNQHLAFPSQLQK
ncbi:hypothetical protein OUZ56_012783 [Daphnia magna]|uniref:Uncharacterized protein n=1 Tax=Daphnia magna TaxID=35525 RepID=A0ABQ9Z4V3_9CRUS|nr:hypothetical protein OUZ56_012783 [Daphnia magna]